MIGLQLDEDLIHPSNISLAHEGLITLLGVGRCQDGPVSGPHRVAGRVGQKRT